MTPETPKTPDARAAQGTVLVVDDNMELVRGIGMLLKNAGYRVVALTSGSMVAETVALHKPDLVVLDVMMPGVDGWEALRRIREDPANEQLCVMMLTAKDGEEAKVRGFTLGADDYLTKPFSLKEFKCRVDALVKRSRRTATQPEDRLPVVCGSATELLDPMDIVYIEGIHNYTYVHTRDGRFLCRLALGQMEDRGMTGFMRIHRSYIVRLATVKAYHWSSKSAFKLQMDNAARTELPVSRTLVSEVKSRLGRG